ncbi:MAG: hypothetical protein VX641_00100 [Planctomycetota bacterium]|nr:hypothetical protein [Planctomycetota bacterium]
MRTFWSLIAVSTLALLILWLLQAPTGDPRVSTPLLESPRMPSKESARPSAESNSTDWATAEPLPSGEGSEAASETRDTLEDQLLTSAQERDDLPALETADSKPTMRDSGPDAAKTGLSLGLDKSIPYVTITPGSIIRSLPDQLEVDGEFTLKGRGTREDPYLPSWDYLFSAGTTYKPRIGKDELPQRIALLDGAWVTISGNTAFPLVVGESSEMLVMLNQWDGCCIGVPPTPFDAIEVRLQKAVKTGPKHSFSYGTVTGRMKVDPYLIENWLVGLYILEESDLQNDL